MLDPLDYGGVLAVYLASPDEINIGPYIEYMLHAGVEVVAPRWNGETYELAKLKGLDEKNLRRGPMGIREPIDADVVEPKSVYAWIIPGLAFTRGGKRLGYGGGWYDRFLASAPKGAVKIGVAYSFQIVDDLPSEPHDIQLTDVVDGSLEDDALEFKETDDGFLAKIKIKDRVQRFKAVGVSLLWTLVASAVFAICLYGMLRGLFGCARCEIRSERMYCMSGLWPFVRKCEISLEGKSPSSGRELTSIDDLFEEAGCYPFSWLPPKYRLPLRLFVEEVLAIDASDDKVRGMFLATKGRRDRSI